MGTNFYARPKVEICPRCKRPFEEIHLGKSSVGWRFLLQANGFKFYKNWKEMKKWLKGKRIYDEYGKRIGVKRFIQWVETKQHTIDPEPVNGDLIDGYKFFDNDFS